MQRKILAVVAAVVGCGGASQSAPDAVTTDPGRYHLVGENERVRVLEYRDRPGDRTEPHCHPDFVLYALAPFTRRIESPDGTAVLREFAVGDVVMLPGQTHVGINVGTTDTHALIVELKQGDDVCLHAHG